MAGRVVRALRALLSPRLGVDGSAASSVAPPGHRPIGVETNAAWAAENRRPGSTGTTAPLDQERSVDGEPGTRR